MRPLVTPRRCALGRSFPLLAMTPFVDRLHELGHGLVCPYICIASAAHLRTRGGSALAGLRLREYVLRPSP